MCDAGEVNYILTRILHTWLGHSPRYDAYNAGIGVLECCKLELARTKLAPYEDGKAVENGPLPDVG